MKLRTAYEKGGSCETYLWDSRHTNQTDTAYNNQMQSNAIQRSIRHSKQHTANTHKRLFDI